jgi:DNA-binding GntR family transcriptional regulator
MDETIAEHERIIERLHGHDQEAFVDVVNGHLRWSLELARSSY